MTLVRRPAPTAVTPWRGSATDTGRRSAALEPALELARQVTVVGLAILLYFGVRGLTQGDHATAVAHGFDVLAIERRLGLDREHWAQGLIVDRPVLTMVWNWIYIWGHWPVIAATLIWLHRADRRAYLVLRNALCLSGAIGLVIFASYAVAPPRLMPIGLVDTVTEHSTSYRVLQPPALVNRYAAVPSLHVGWNLLIGVALWRASRRRLIRAVAVAGPVLMATAVVVTANHYVIDGMVGAAVALTGWALSGRLTPRLVAADARLRARVASWSRRRAGAW
ncbi:MAG: phosphatase PAP2 family protein [Acidimicrobiales bacterium]